MRIMEGQGVDGHVGEESSPGVEMMVFPGLSAEYGIHCCPVCPVVSSS